MAITRTGVVISTNTTFGDSDDRDFYINGGQLGINQVPVSGLNPDTVYYAKGYVQQDGTTITDPSYKAFKTMPLKFLTIKNEKKGSITVTLTKNGSPNDITLDYSTDGANNWTTWSSANGNFSITLQEGESVNFKGNNSSFSNGNGYYKFGANGSCSGSGDVNTLIDENGGDIEYTYTRGYYLFTRLFEDMGWMENRGIVLPSTKLFTGCYYYMFSNSAITNVPELPAKSLTNAGACYSHMFYKCRLLTSVPSDLLPATIISSSCYESMFAECRALLDIPNLPAKDLSSAKQCYEDMFGGCTSITSLPTSMISATTLSEGCFRGMFAACSSLLSVPSNFLPVTTLEKNCYYNMFGSRYIGLYPSFCSSLSSVPSDLLPATSLAEGCYAEMFHGCSFTQGPTLPANRLEKSAYESMFAYCRSLNKIICYASDISATDCLNDWVDHVAAAGDFYRLGGATFPSGDSGIPTGWTEHTSL